MRGTRDRVELAIGGVLFNASNFPERVKTHVLGENMAPLREMLTTAVLVALGRCACVEDVVCSTCMTSPTPPADDVREAMLDAVSDVLADAFSDAVTERIAADVLTRLSVTHEVRPRSTVTDAEVEAVPARCGRRVPGTVPSWAGQDQIDPCSCVRPSGHEAGCACSHDAPSDAVEAAREVHA